MSMSTGMDQAILKAMESRMDLRCVGMVLTDGNDLKEVVTEDVCKAGADCYYSNDPYGVVGLSGFGNYRLKAVDFAIEKGQKEWQELKQIITSKLYGEIQAVIMCTEGLILVRDMESFVADLLDRKSNTMVRLPGDLVVMFDAEDDLDEEQLDEIINY